MELQRLCYEHRRSYNFKDVTLRAQRATEGHRVFTEVTLEAKRTQNCYKGYTESTEDHGGKDLYQVIGTLA